MSRFASEETSSLTSTETGCSFLNLDSEDDFENLFDLELYRDLRLEKEGTKAMTDPDDLSLTEYLLRFGNSANETADSINGDDFSWPDCVPSPSPSPSPSLSDDKAPSKSDRKTIIKTNTDSPEDKYEGTNRKAVMAKRNRERKKQHVAELEQTVEQLRKDKDNLLSTVEHLEETLDDVTTEISYLRGVLANQSELSALLKTIGTTPGVKFGSSSLLTQSHDYSPSVKRKRKSGGKGGADKSKKNKPSTASPIEAGVCLHVRKGKVSLEFCTDCNQKATDAEAVTELDEPN